MLFKVAFGYTFYYSYMGDPYYEPTITVHDIVLAKHCNEQLITVSHKQIPLQESHVIFKNLYPNLCTF